MTTVLRARRDHPMEQARLRLLTDATATILNFLGGMVVDVEVDDAKVDDVRSVLQTMGFSIYEYNPTLPIDTLWEGIEKHGEPGQVLIVTGEAAYAGTYFTKQTPITSPNGWLVNASGLLLVH